MTIFSKKKNILKLLSKKTGLLLIGFATITFGLSEIIIPSINTKTTEAASCVDTLFVDSSFSSGSGTNSTPNVSVIQPDGKIIIGGPFSNYNGVIRNRIARLNSDGTLDTTFNIGLGANAQIQAMVLQPDGKILIGGAFTSYNGTARNRIARLNSDGTLDTTFTIGSGVSGTTVQAIALQSDGKIIIAGGNLTSYNGTPRNRIVRLNSNGTIDTSFQNITSLNLQFSVPKLAIQSDGKIILGGLLNVSDPNSTSGEMIGTIRLNSNGTIDTSYNHNLEPDQTFVASLDIRPDGKIISVIRGTSTSRIYRLNSNGSLDTTFNNEPQVSYNFPLILSDGKILIGNGNNIIRLNSNGSLDSSFSEVVSNGQTNILLPYTGGRILAIGSFTSLANQASVNSIALLDFDTVCTYNLVYSGAAGGSVSGNLNQFVLQGGSGSSVLAVPNPGYQFSSWSDGLTENPRRDLEVNSDITVTALFRISAPCDTSPDAGFAKVAGYGFMGVNIEESSSNPQGGLGWIKFNCSDGEPDWGTKVIIDEGGPNHGRFTGQAWSNNNGWLSFDESVVSSCLALGTSGVQSSEPTSPFQTASSGVGTLNPGASTVVRPYNGPAKIMFDGTQNPKIIGWAKFINGDDQSNGGYNGCVSFSGTNYGTFVDIPTGALRGWAWGSNVVGWLSFQNSECRFCDAEIELPPEDEKCDDPLATNYNQPGACIYGPIIPGCTDPLAINYNASANQNDGSCEYRPTDGGGRPTLNLDVSPNSFTVGGPNLNGQFVATNINWTSNNPSQISPNSCVGSFALNSGGLIQTSTISGWTGGRANPNSTLSNITVPQASTASAGTQLVFTINCQTVNGENITATDSIIMTAGPAVTATLELRIDSPNINPPNGDTSFEILGAGGATVTLGWDSENVQPGSCVASSIKTPDTLGSNNQWEGSVPDSGTRQINMQIPGIGNGVSTQFRITCNDANGFTPISRVVNVCIADTACPVTQSGLFPGYQEF